MKPNWIKTIDNEEYIKLNEAMEMVKERDNYIKQQSNTISATEYSNKTANKTKWYRFTRIK